jgi:hypothetical protein
VGVRDCRLDCQDLSDRGGDDLVALSAVVIFWPFSAILSIVINAYRYLRSQGHLADCRSQDAWDTELTFLDELKEVKDDMQEVLRIEGLKEF